LYFKLKMRTYILKQNNIYLFKYKNSFLRVVNLRNPKHIIFVELYIYTPGSKSNLFRHFRNGSEDLRNIKLS